MGDHFATYALRRKRARLAGEVLAAQTALAKKRETLATPDSVIRMFEPASNPELIAPIRPSSRRCLYFEKGEMMRLAVSASREAGKPISCREVTEYALTAKGLNPDPIARADIVETVRNSLVRLAAKGLARKLGEWPEKWWEMEDCSEKRN